MLLLAGQARDKVEAELRLVRALNDGLAFAKFREWIAMQGGDVTSVDDPSRLPTARFIREVSAPQSGYIASLNARQVGLTSMLLGAGRAKKGDQIDHAAESYCMPRSVIVWKKARPCLQSMPTTRPDGPGQAALASSLRVERRTDQPAAVDPSDCRLIRRTRWYLALPSGERLLGNDLPIDVCCSASDASPVVLLADHAVGVVYSSRRPVRML